MKLLYKKARSVRYFKRKQKRLSTLRKKRNRREKRTLTVDDWILALREKLRVNKRKKRWEEIKVPEKFSLEDSTTTEQATSFFSKTYDWMASGKPVKIDMRHVESISPGALLYFISNMHIFKKIKSLAVRGNMPENTECWRFLCNAGFGYYVKTNLKILINEKSQNTLKIASGNDVSAKVSAKTIDFIEKKVGERIVLRKFLFKALQEVMGNVTAHAYLQRCYKNDITKYHYHPSWWMMANQNKHNKLDVVLLDNGETIAATMRKNYREKIAELLKLPEWICRGCEDKDLICSGLRGEFRTNTGKRYRGKGLPVLYTWKQKDVAFYINEITVISGSAFIKIRQDGDFTKTLKNEFHGTLVSFSIKKEASENEDN